MSHRSAHPTHSTHPAHFPGDRRVRHSLSRLLLLLGPLVLLAIMGSAGEAPALDDGEDVPRIRSGATPPGGIETLPMRELWRAGGADEEVIFGEIEQIVADTEGNLYVLDSQLCQVMVFGPEGKFLRTLSREGEGPGEIRQPGDLAFLADGTLGIVQRFPGVIVKLQKDGTPAGNLHPAGDPTAGGFGSIMGIDYRNDRLAIMAGTMTTDMETGEMSRLSYLGLFDDEGVKQVEFLNQTRLIDFSAPAYIERDDYSVEGRWALGPDGAIYAAATRDAYAISVFAPDGRTVRMIERDYAPRRRTAAEMALPGAHLRLVMNGEEVEIRREIEEHDPCITRLAAMADGTLWVLTPHGTHENPAGVLETWDVFDRQGHYRRQVAIAPDTEFDYGRTFLLRDDRLVVVLGWIAQDVAPVKDIEPLEIICYLVATR